jgi:tRNA (guanine-N7-)-methyltransferase
MVRVRQHYNPFSAPTLTEPLNLNELFVRPDLPLNLEVGPAEGKFMIDYALKYPERNILGIEIKFKLVERLSQKIQEGELANAAVLRANINTSLAAILPDQSLDHVFILFPDPWYKDRHIKRRVIKADFLDILSRKMKSGGILYVKTDVDFMAQDIRVQFSPRSDFKPLSDHSLDIMTKLEGYKAEENREVFEFVFEFVL